MSNTATSSSEPPVPVSEYVAQLPRKRMAAAVLFHDDRGRVLLLEPSYKPNWELPGGAVEDDEAPWETATRELLEELGWPVRLDRLLLVDYVRPQDQRPEGVVFVFDGGTISEETLPPVSFEDGEILSAGLHTAEQARPKVKALLADRITSALTALERGGTVVCEQGQLLA